MKRVFLTVLASCVLSFLSGGVFADGFKLNLGPEEIVLADGGDILVLGYSVPSFVDWDNDGFKDLVVGEGSSFYSNAKVRIYLNTGTGSNPLFDDYFYAQSNGSDLTCTGSGCMGCFPRVVYWDADSRKDLLVGQSDGTVRMFLNVATDEDPTFDAGALLQVGPTGTKTNIDVGMRATATVADWNSDGKKDLVVGAYDARIHIFLNEGTDTEPDFVSEIFAQEDGSNLIVTGFRSSLAVLDLDGDEKKDILTGNTNGQLFFYKNVGTDAAPSFSGYMLVTSNGVAIDLPGTPRSRPSVCDWTNDGYPDVLIGISDGKVHLYQSVGIVGDLDKDYDVDTDDFVEFAQCWQQSVCDDADIDGDGDVDFGDFEEFVANWLVGVE